jgi:hypothetical protein
MTTDLFLKFESQEQAKPFLYNVTIEHRDPETNSIVEPTMDMETQEPVYPEGTVEVEVLGNKFINTDVIGDIWKPTEEMQTISGPGDVEMEVPVMEKLVGWHVNIRPTGEEDTSQLQPFAVVPQNPVRVWA